MCKIKELFEAKAKLNEVIAYTKNEVKDIDKQINALVTEEFEKSRKAQDKHTGTIIWMFDGGVKVKETRPKKVDWDQELLSECWSNLIHAQVEPTDYITAKYSVAEKTYSSLTEDVRKWIEPARTEKQGPAKLELVDEV